MEMTEKQRNAKEHAENFMRYLFEKYSSQIQAELERREELHGCSSSFLHLGIPFFSYLLYNKRKYLRGRKNGKGLSLHTS